MPKEADVPRGSICKKSSYAVEFKLVKKQNGRVNVLVRALTAQKLLRDYPFIGCGLDEKRSYGRDAENLCDRGRGLCNCG